MTPAFRIAFALGALTILSTPVASTRADVLWTENAENGYANVIDNTGPTYPLIQAEIVSQGANAFHLANPSFADNSFVVNHPIAIQADTKLFFQSQMGFVASGQTARVQMSTNGGSTWPTNLYTQVGTSTGSAPVEGAFNLRTINLAPYAGQTALFRFYLDYLPGGQAFTQIDTGVGWYIDDIQFADQLQKTQYSIGNPSDEAQLYLEYINRARADALVEANRLVNETAPGVQSAYNFFGIQDADIINQFSYYVSNGIMDQYSQPLAFNAKLLQAAQLHTQDMFNFAFQGHDSSSNPPSPLVPFGDLGDRLNAVGYAFSNAGENVYSFSESPAEGHAAFDVDWGHDANPGDPDYEPAFNGQGMQNPAGHRRTIHNNTFKEIGIGIVNGTNGDVGPQLVTQDFATPGDATFITGVVYEDLDVDNFYDIGEGRSGVRVDVEGSAFYAISTATGGYTVPVSGNGSHNVMFTGGGFSSYATVANVVDGNNVKIDYLVSTAPSFEADFDDDGDVDGNDLAVFGRGFGENNLGDADGDNDTDGFDFLTWQRQFGLDSAVAAANGVPEPGAILLLMTAAPLIANRRTRRRH